MVKMFSTQTVLLAECHTWVIVWGVVWTDANRRNRFAVSMLMQASQSFAVTCNLNEAKEESVMYYSWLVLFLLKGIRTGQKSDNKYLNETVFVFCGQGFEAFIHRV